MNVPARRYLLAGGLLAILSAALLVTPPASFVGRGATFIDTEAWQSTGGGVPVTTTEYLRSTDAMEKFPEHVGEEWYMTGDLEDEWRGVANFFRADAFLSRNYAQDGLYVPLHLFVIDSKYTRVLHSLQVSYGIQGFTTFEDERIWIDVEDADWLAEDSPNARVPVVQALAVKENATGGPPLERRIVQYFWVKREAWGVTNHLTWVGASLPVPINGTLDRHWRLLTNFTSAVVGEMFVPDDPDVAATVAEALWLEGGVSLAILGASIAVPAGLLGTGLYLSRRRPPGPPPPG